MHDIRTPRTVTTTTAPTGLRLHLATDQDLGLPVGHGDEREHVHSELDPPAASATPVTDWHVTEAMRVWGGSFVSGLGELYRKADAQNKAKLRDAFPDYFAKYTEIATMKVAELER